MKKSDCHIHASLKQRLEAVHKLRYEHKIKTLCKVLNVNRSTYYKHFHSPLSKRELENQTLRTKILQLYNASDKRLGVKKMKQRLMAEYGINISVGRVHRLMKSMQLPKMSTHRSNVRRMKNYDEQAENILKRQFYPPAPNMVWVSDITFIRTTNHSRTLLRRLL
ncbi:MAG: IS3 family transposase [Synergistaceae bacterium]|nr:IS3 family transposase [Synergistaceae bacterium]